MLVHQAFRFELDPNDRTRSALASHGGASRFAFNWGLALVKSRLDQRQRLEERALIEGFSSREAEAIASEVSVPWSLPALRREWNRAKPEVAPWWPENSKEAYSSGLDGLARALKAFSDSKGGTRPGKAVGFPRFKRRGGRVSCRFTTGALRVIDDRHVRLPHIGVIRTKESTAKLNTLLHSGLARILSATISESAGRWSVSFTVEAQRVVGSPSHPDQVVGVDLGVSSLAVLSTGEVVANPKPLHRYAKRISRLQRRLARQRHGGRNEPPSKRAMGTRGKLARCHRRVAALRQDSLHKLTTRLVKTYGTVVIEDLNVAGMSARGTRSKAGLNRAILDASPATLRRQLSYKASWKGSRLVVADRWFPSSKTCSACKAVKAKLLLAERTFHCEHCGLLIERDLNAAINLAALAAKVAASGAETENGRGGERSQAGHAGQCSPVNRQAGRENSDKTGTAVSQ